MASSASSTVAGSRVANSSATGRPLEIEVPKSNVIIWSSGAGQLAVIVSMYRRALPSTVTMLGAVFGYLLGGAVIMEDLFGLGGMGQFASTR